MPRDLPPLHDALAFLSPTSDARGHAQAAWLAEDLAGGTLLDVGCGWAELLLRVAQRAPSARVLGVDLDDAALAEARRRAEQRGLTGTVELVAGEGATTGPEQVDALVAVGATQVWGPPVEDDQPLAYAEALAAMRARVRRGGRVLYGEGIWSRPPTPEAIAPLAGREDEFVTLAELVRICESAGFGVVAAHEATQEEWDEFESGFCAGYVAWLAAHPADHPDAEEVRDRLARQRAAYLRGYRGVLGFAHLQLVAL